MTPADVNTALESGIGMPEPSAATATLFLDFDGVIHPEYCHPSRLCCTNPRRDEFPLTPGGVMPQAPSQHGLVG